MARVIHATTMKPTIANPCFVAGSSGNGANHTATGTTIQRICPTMTSGGLGFSYPCRIRALEVQKTFPVAESLENKVGPLAERLGQRGLTRAKLMICKNGQPPGCFR